MLWAQRKRRRKTGLDCEQGGSPQGNESWIKSHFSRLSEEKLIPDTCASTSSHAAQPESWKGEANTTIRMDTFTTQHGEGGRVLSRDSFSSKQRMSGPLVSKETHKQSGKSSSTDEAMWAAVAACTQEIDAKGKHLANSMLQRAAAVQHSGRLESRDISPEELKALEEVEMKLKGNFLTQQETTIAGANHTHTFHGQGHHGHKGHTVRSSHKGHPSHSGHQGHPAHPGHQSHPAHPSHQGHPAHPSHQGHPAHPSHHQGHPAHPSHQGHPAHPSHQGHPGHSSHQSFSLPNRSHQIYDS